MGSRLCVVIPVYNEQEILEKNIVRIENVLTGALIEHELILVDDGSKDGSYEIMKRLADRYATISCVKLSRNFGKEGAISAGLDAFSGDCCVVMDCDMQHPPETLPEMYRLWKEEGYEVVEGVKSDRGEESFLHKLNATLFYKVLLNLSGIDLNNASDFRLMDSAVVAAWKRMPERQTFFRAMSTWVGFNRTQVYFEVGKREGGESRWSTLTLMKLALNAITSFSAAPLQLVTVLGVLCLIASVILSIQSLVKKLSGHALEGFTSVTLLILIIGSMLMISLGIIGMYIARIYNEIKARPRYIVQNYIKCKNNEQKGSSV